MTWQLTLEEEFDPLLVPPVAMEYPRPLPEAEVPYLVGSPDLNKWYSATEHGYPSQGYAGPTTPVMGDQRPAFQERLRYGRGKLPSAYEADYPQSFFPEVVDSYEAIFNRQPAASTQERMWSGSDARFDMTFADRRSANVYAAEPEGHLSGLGDEINASWYETPVGAIGLALGVGVVSYFATRAFLRSKDRNF